jgi:hypothetical protein
VTLRALSVVTVFVGATLLATGLTMLGEAGAPPEMRHLRRMKMRDRAPDHVVPVTAASMAELPHRASLARRAGIESTCVSLEGWNQRMMLAGDGDIHLEITASPRRPDSRDTAYVTAEVTPVWRAGHSGWNYEALVAAFRPNRGGATPWDSGPRRVRVTGWLLYDFQYDRRASSSAPPHGSARLTGWELHPVTRIETWDEARSAWAEVAR